MYKGAVGLSFVQEALRAGHRLTLYVRSPSKLPKNVQQNINVHIVEGDFSDMEAVKKALNDGADVLVSLVGPAIPNKGMVCICPSTCATLSLKHGAGHHRVLRQVISVTPDR